MLGEVAIACDDGGGVLARLPDDVLVTDHLEHLQAGALAGLRCAQDVTFTALLEVDARELEPVAGRRHRIEPLPRRGSGRRLGDQDRKSTRLNSSHVKISYAVF